MTINNKNSWANSAPDWSPLTKCFGNTGISIGDVDGVVERNGWQAYFEAKGPGVNIPNGQKRMFKKITFKGSFVAVFVLFGVSKSKEKPCEKCSSIKGMASLNTINKFEIYNDGKVRTYDNTNLDYLISWVDWWFQCANKKQWSPEILQNKDDLFRPQKAYDELKEQHRTVVESHSGLCRLLSSKKPHHKTQRLKNSQLGFWDVGNSRHSIEAPPCHT